MSTNGDVALPSVLAQRIPPPRKKEHRARKFWRSKLLEAIAEMSAEGAAEAMQIVRERKGTTEEILGAAERVQGLALRALIALDLRRLPAADTEPLAKLLTSHPEPVLRFSPREMAKLRELLGNAATAAESTLDPERPKSGPGSRVSLIEYIMGVGGDFLDGSSSRGSYLYDSQPTPSTSPKSKKRKSIHALAAEPNSLPPGDLKTVVRVERSRRAKMGEVRGRFHLPAHLRRRLEVAQRVVMDVARGKADDATLRAAAMILSNTNPFKELLDRTKEPDVWAAEIRPTGKGHPRRGFSPEELHWLFGHSPPKTFVEFSAWPVTETRVNRKHQELYDRLRPYQPDLMVARMECGGCRIRHLPTGLTVTALPVKSTNGLRGKRGWHANRIAAESVMLRCLDVRAGVKHPWRPGRLQGGLVVEER